ncbi:uncharacterized protein JN550_001098 [Neoarthrinium moseri]|uniref:uncharacterized protein n=1 Tax=Neoarthrinium moseri TaxID=1658444 RepID=UPI001FDC4A0C|nr:uncharacterized protein JN550_001098 [Neoarthrinium moseri]KAI1877026.1 hypothetical protein JN550_001098 [Neoarthrinium moseri]
MEFKKSSGAVGVGSANTDTSIYEREVSTTRRVTQRLRNSVELRRQSRSSLRSESRSSTSVSCVTRQTIGDDCAKQRFIVWAAVKRNRSVRMAPNDRLRCPLIRCGEQFTDHESMLSHLHECQHLESGEYVCYECMRVEKFNDGRCKCCLGQPTKRRRIINAAKTFFSTLGHKSRKDDAFEVDQEEFGMEPPSYDSLDIGEEPEAPSEAQLPLEPEISGTEILEMDAAPMFPVELDSVNYESRPEPPQQPSSQNGNSLYSEFTTLRPPEAPSRGNLQQLQANNGSRPSLAVDTNLDRPRKVPRTKYLSPSSSLRSTNSSQGIISPLSAGSGIWTNASAIDTTLASPITPFSADGTDPGTLSRENSCKFPKDYHLPSSNPGWSTGFNEAIPSETPGLPSLDDNYILDNISELPGDLPVPRIWGSDPLLFSFDPKDNYSWSSTMDTEVNVLFTGNHLASDVQDESASDTKTLVAHTSEALRAQMAYTVPNVKNVNNALARRLEALSSREVSLKGLASLRRILNGVDPTDPLDYLCFIHLIYAFSIVIHEEETSARSYRLFQQAIAYRGFLSARDRDMYQTTVAALWEPRDSNKAQAAQAALNRSSSSKGKNPELRFDSRSNYTVDPLVGEGLNFLDDLEFSVMNSTTDNRPIEVLTSDLWSEHLSADVPGTQHSADAFSVAATYIVQMLRQKFSSADQSETLIRRLKSADQRVTAGQITTIRRFELELLQAGKATLDSSQLFDDYVPQVRSFCDNIYAQQGYNPRQKYQVLGISLVESLIQAQAQDSVQPQVAVNETIGQQHSSPTFSVDTNDASDPLAEFLKDFDTRNFADDFILPMDPSLGETVEAPSEPTPGTIASPAKMPAPSHHRTIDPASLLSHVDAESQPKISPEPKDQNYLAEAQTSAFTTADEPQGQVDEGAPAEGSTPASTQQQKVEADSCCDICGYRPKGDPQWFKGSMAKHKKLQHSANPPKIYKCPYPGCVSAYKNRPDNLRQHQIEKGHFVEGEGRTRRPGKRKQMDEE